MGSEHVRPAFHFEDIKGAVYQVQHQESAFIDCSEVSFTFLRVEIRIFQQQLRQGDYDVEGGFEIVPDHELNVFLQFFRMLSL